MCSFMYSGKTETTDDSVYFLRLYVSVREEIFIDGLLPRVGTHVSTCTRPLIGFSCWANYTVWVEMQYWLRASYHSDADDVRGHFVRSRIGMVIKYERAGSV